MKKILFLILLVGIVFAQKPTTRTPVSTDWVKILDSNAEAWDHTLDQIFGASLDPTFGDITADNLTLTADADIGDSLSVDGNATVAGTLEAVDVDITGTGEVLSVTITSATAGGYRAVDIQPSHGTAALTGTIEGVYSSARINYDSPSGSVNGITAKAGNMSVGADIFAARGVYAEVVNKIPVGATTWTHARGYEVNMDLNQGTSGNATTFTNTAMFYGLYNLPTVATYTTVTNGYGIFIRNEQVGGNGQMLDAGFYLDDLNMGGGIKGWDYGIDFGSIESNFGTADMRLSNSDLIVGNHGATLGSATGAVAVNYLSASNQTIVTLTDYAMPIVDSEGSGGHGSLKIIDFPEGIIRIEGVIGDISITAVSGIGATGTFDMAMGSTDTDTDDETLEGAEVDLFLSSFLLILVSGKGRFFG